MVGAYNFGPAAASHRSVAELVQEVLLHWSASWEDDTNPATAHKAGLLQLSIDKAQVYLQWSPAWDFAVTVRHTTGWQRDARMLKHAENFQPLTRQQIGLYGEAARFAGAAWTKD